MCVCICASLWTNLANSKGSNVVLRSGCNKRDLAGLCALIHLLDCSSFPYERRSKFETLFTQILVFYADANGTGETVLCFE